jgi:hypothetical protein
VSTCVIGTPGTSGAQSTAAISRDPAQWPFSIDSPWNTPVGSGVTFAPIDDPRTSDLRAATVAINAATWSMPVSQASRKDPVRLVTTHAGRWHYRIPDSATPAAPAHGDRQLLVIDPTHRFVDECWVARRTESGLTCRYHVRNELRGTGVGNGGTRAYGGSALAGLIRTREIKQRSIRHALALAVPRRNLAHGPVWPATSEDGNANYGGSLPMGSLVSIPRSVDLNRLGLSPRGLAIARALQDYGAYLVDASENFTLFAEPTAEPLLASARSDLNAIRSALRIVTNSSEQNVAGGGSRVADPAPPFDH